MLYATFSARFPKDTEIGRLTTDEEIAIYHDNGRDVGVWRIDQLSMEERGEVLGQAQATEVRRYFGGEVVGRGR